MILTIQHDDYQNKGKVILQINIAPAHFIPAIDHSIEVAGETYLVYTVKSIFNKVGIVEIIIGVKPA